MAAAGCDDDKTISVFDWEARRLVATIGGLNKVDVTHLAWSSKADTPNEFCACGPKTVAFYYLGAGGAGLTLKQGKFGAAERVNFLSVAYSEKGTACVASETGDLYWCAE